MALLKYSALRIGLLVVTGGVLWLVGLRGWLLLLVAFLVSGVVSIFALNRARDEVSASLVNRQAAIRRATDTEASAEPPTSAQDEPDTETDR